MTFLTKEDIRLWRLAKKKKGAYSLNNILRVQRGGYEKLFGYRLDITDTTPEFYKVTLELLQDYVKQTRNIQNEMMEDIKKRGT